MLPANAGDKDSTPGLGRSPGEEMATRSSSQPENLTWMSLGGYSLWGHKELDILAREQLSRHGHDLFYLMGRFQSSTCSTEDSTLEGARMEGGQCQEAAGVTVRAESDGDLAPAGGEMKRGTGADRYLEAISRCSGQLIQDASERQ